MTARNLQSRLVRLETRTARPNELLVIWHKPGTDIHASIADHRLASGDKVICPEWTGSTEPPAPQWHRSRVSASMTEEEYDCVMQSMKRAAEVGEDTREGVGLVPFPRMSQEAMQAMPDNELLHAVMGVRT